MSDWTLSAEMGSAARERLFEAALAELGERGYDGVSVELALRRCGVPREELEAELLADKDACLFAAFDQQRARLIAEAEASCNSPGVEWPERVQEGLRRVLDELAARPAVARGLTRSFPAIRPAAYRRYVAFLEEFASLLRGGREFSTEAAELPAEIELLAVGSVEAIVIEKIDAGRTAELPSLLPSILFSVLVPFLGPEAASAAMLEAQGEA